MHPWLFLPLSILSPGRTLVGLFAALVLTRANGAELVPQKDFKAVIFNPGPGPPMGANTRLNDTELFVDDVLLFEPAASHTARIESDKLRLIIADNEAFGAHRAGYNGVAELLLATPEAKNL